MSKDRPGLSFYNPAKSVCVSKAEKTFLTRAIQHYPDKLAQFRMRPVVCCAGTCMNCWSKWFDS